MPSDDEQLLERWRAGNVAAGNELVARHFSSVYGFFWRRVEGVAEDLTQRTFLACVEGHARVRNTAGFRAYLLGIARHILLRHFRERSRRDRRTIVMDSSLPHSTRSPSRRLADRDEARSLLVTLRELPLELQLVLELYYWEEMSTEEIACVLDVPAGTVKSRLFRARRAAEAALRRFRDFDALRRTTAGDFAAWAKALRAHLDDPDCPTPT